MESAVYGLPSKKVQYPGQLQTRENCVPNRKGYGTKGGGEGLEVFVFLLSGEGETRLEFVIKCQHHSKIHPIKKKIRPENPPGSSG